MAQRMVAQVAALVMPTAPAGPERGQVVVVELVGVEHYPVPLLALAGFPDDEGGAGGERRADEVEGGGGPIHQAGAWLLAR